MHLSILHVAGLMATIALIVGIGFYSGKKVSSAEDFSGGGGKAGPWIVCGAIMGTLVSGQATIGTAQLAFTYGMSAWWFTLGSGLGCLILAVGFTVPLRRSCCKTLLQIVSREYGPKAESLGSAFCSIGIFISVVAQVLAATALFTTIIPSMNHLTAALISIVLMAIYVVFAGLGGVAKLILLYVSSIVGGVLVFGLAHGFSGLMETLQALLAGTELGELSGLADASAVRSRFTSLIARGASKDIGSGLSLILGVLSTQTYAQGIWSGKSDSAARTGSLLSALLIPPIGIACIMIGLYMRGHCITAAEVETLQAMGQAVPADMIRIASTSQVFPVFVVTFLPKLLGGVVLGTLFMTVVGGGSGLALGMASILVTDIFTRKSTHLKESSRTFLAVTRGTILGILVVAAIVAILVPGAMINDFGFLSMGLRGAVVFLPMCGGLWLKGKIGSSYAVASIIAGPIAVLAGKLMGLPFDPLFFGMAVCLLIMLAGLAQGGRSKSSTQDVKHPEKREDQ